MVRMILTYVLPLVTPTLLYLLWIGQRNRRLAARGAPPAEPHPLPWLLLGFIGVGFAFIVVGVTSLRDGAPAGSVYVPPHMDDGRVVEGEMRPPPSVPPRP